MTARNDTDSNRTGGRDQQKETIKLFFKALKANDVQMMTALHADGFDLTQAEIWSDTSLPEMAMNHGASEAAWWLMTNGVMPTDWTRFSGAAGKAFLKKGFEMARTGRVDGLTLKTYAQIAGVVARKTGERLPDLTEDLINTLDGFLGRAAEKAGPVVDRAVDKAVSDFSPLVDKAAERAGKFLSGLGKQLEGFRARVVSEMETGAEDPINESADEPVKPNNKKESGAAAAKAKVKPKTKTNATKRQAPSKNVKKETPKSSVKKQPKR